MSEQSNPPERKRAGRNQSRVDFLRTDLSLCFTFADVAATRLKMGNQESARQAIADAEAGYQTLSRFLLDPKHVRHLTDDEIRELTAELRRLRERLDGLQR